MEVAPELPQSVFNTQSQAVLNFLYQQNASTYVYPHQIDAVKYAHAQLQRQDMPNIALVVLPTGCGKTGVAVLAAYVLNASRVLVITPSVKISKQIHEAFCGSLSRKCFLVERGIIQDAEIHRVCPQGTCITDYKYIRKHIVDPFMVVNAHKIGGQSRVAIAEIPTTNYDLVIVDEAHHYPAPTWKTLVDHFPNSRRLFITATPEYKGKPILDHAPCFTLSRNDAVLRGIIRDLSFDEVLTDGEDFFYQLKLVAHRIIHFLDQHDKEDPEVKHQAMVMAQTIKDLNSATVFKMAYDSIAPACEVYVDKSPPEILVKFDRGEIRTLVIVGKLLEGYDNKRVSVVAIVRNVAKQSKVLFTQFVGRAVRKCHPKDPVTAVIVSHQIFNQRGNFDQFDMVTDEENDDSEYDIKANFQSQGSFRQ